MERKRFTHSKLAERDDSPYAAAAATAPPGGAPVPQFVFQDTVPRQHIPERLASILGVRGGGGGAAGAPSSCSMSLPCWCWESCGRTRGPFSTRHILRWSDEVQAMPHLLLFHHVHTGLQVCEEGSLV